MVRSDRVERLSDAAEVLRAWIRQVGSFRTADSVLAKLGGPAAGELILVSPDGRVLAASSPQYRAASASLGPGGRLTLEVRDRAPGSLRIRHEVLLGGPRAAIRGPDGAQAILYRLPRDPDDDHGGLPFIASVNRWLLLAAGASALLAILLALALSRRILAPVEALTQAARSLEAGDLSRRVPVRSADEIAGLARAFNSMADALERNETARRRLLGDVAHELRSPLTNIRCQVEAIQDGLAKADSAAMQSLHEEALLLGRLIDDIRDLALAEAGRLPLHKERLSPSALVEAALLAMGSLAAERRITLRARAGRAPAIEADPDRLAQILRNLLSNAIAHTPPQGWIEVDAAGEGAMVHFTVRDSGAGIAPEHLPHVFDRFYRGDPARPRETGGAGLGLSIVKELIEAHGGRVEAVSAPGSGATIRFTLPQAPAS